MLIMEPSGVCFHENRLVSCKTIFMYNNTIFITFGITLNTYVRMCGNIIPRHTCDEYSILV
jgi:hypothetical protein